MTTIDFTDNARQDLADIHTFQTFVQKIPVEIADNINISILKKSSFLLANLPYSGKAYGWQGDDEIWTIAILKKYMVFYHYDLKQETVSILHIFCTLMDDKVLHQKLEEEGIVKHIWR